MNNLITWRNEKRKVEDLKPFENNPRKATEKEITGLSESLAKFNIADPLIINTDGTVIGGNFRLSLLKQQGIKEVDVRVPSRTLTKEEADELNLRLNKNLGLWDNDLLAKFNEDLLKNVGFTQEELDQVFGLDISDNFDEEKEFQKAVKEPRGVKTGDIWEMGDHRIIVGDCTVRENWEKLLGNERFDFMFTDPPYRISYAKTHYRKVQTKEGAKLKSRRIYSGVGETDAKGKPKGFGYKQNRVYTGIINRGVPEYDEWLSIANDFQNPIGANVMIFENWRNVVDLWKAIEKYWRIRNIVIWWLPNRQQGFSAKYKFFSKYDIAPLADKGQAIQNDEYEEEFEKYLADQGQRLLDTYEVIIYGQQGHSIWDFKKGGKWSRVSDHITSPAETESGSGGNNLVFGKKPVQILVPYIKTLSQRGGIVMEPFGGSGSTMIASEIMKRKCRLIEISPLYTELILNRFEKFTGIQPKKLN